MTCSIRRERRRCYAIKKETLVSGESLVDAQPSFDQRTVSRL